MSNITCQEEKFIDLIEEIKPLLIKHWEELANNKGIRELDPDFDMYVKLNELGTLRIFTIRVNGKLVGYSSFLIANNPHYKTWKYASSDVYYLDNSLRGLGLGKTFFSEIEEWLKSLDVKSVTVQDKLNHSHQEFFVNMGFKPIEQLYEKVL